ncbi:MAG TPA: PfkB family carbohydrate kinase [Bryobacteraceae bacterium]|nr:PfkB family carbohydrate kinase [Bryobacteraceae bacterium]
MTHAEILSVFPKLRVLVVGDVCLDRWCRYDPALADPSRETGIPRVGVIATETTPGAAGTVANNVAALGARVSVLGLLGTDGFGYELDRALEARGIDGRLLVSSDEVCTFTYTKLINCQTGVEDLPRLDFVNTRPAPEELDREVVRRLEEAAPDFDVILVSDQAETEAGGVVTPAVRAALARISRALPKTVVWVDSRMRAEQFRGVIVKGNSAEIRAASRRAIGRFDCREFRRRTESPVLVITCGANGAVVVTGESAEVVWARRIGNPVDICGAGDSFSAGAALTLKVTGDPIAAAEFGNLVSSITIMKKGTGTASPHEVLTACATGAS